MRIEPGAPFPTVQEVEPNDDATTATAVTGAFEAGGDLAETSYDVYAWTVSEPGRWDIEARGPLEQTVSIEVTGPDGRRIGSASGWGATLYDRALEPGTYQIRLGPRADTPRPYVLRAVPNDAPDGEFGRPGASADASRARAAPRGSSLRPRSFFTSPDGLTENVTVIRARCKPIRAFWHGNCASPSGFTPSIPACPSRTRRSLVATSC